MGIEWGRMCFLLQLACTEHEAEDNVWVKDEQNCIPMCFQIFTSICITHNSYMVGSWPPPFLESSYSYSQGGGGQIPREGGVASAPYK